MAFGIGTSSRWRRVVRRRESRLLVSALALAVLVPAGLSPVASAQESGLGRPDVPEQRVSKVEKVTGLGGKAARDRVARDRKANAAQAKEAEAQQRVSWPKGGAATGSIASGTGTKLSPGGLPVTLSQPTVKGHTQASSGGGAAVDARVEVLGREATDRLGITGVVLSAAAESAGQSEVSVDYSRFASAVGGGWAGRLRLVLLPACALSNPEKPSCRKQTPLDSDNDFNKQTVSASVALPGVKSTDAPLTVEKSATATVLALTAAAAGSGESPKGTGDYTATKLSESSSWQAGGSSGSFTWSYEFTMPPAAAGPSPSLGLSYDSGSIDGRTATTNNQGTSVGEGFSVTESYIERSYGSCDDDGHEDVFDRCWKYDNANLVLNGKSTRLVKDDTTGKWRLQGDDASQVTRSTGAVNDDNDGEYWTVVTGDGTKYVFGQNKLDGAGSERTNSTWTVPVYGDDTGEPGYSNGSAFADRSVDQAWRWNLDYVVDTHDNAATYWYTAESNYYKKNKATKADTPYTPGGYLTEVKYGLRKGALFTDNADGRVTFDYTGRCTSSTADCSSLTKDTSEHWPDVPFDAICAKDSTDCNGGSATFFSRKRLTGINTQSWSAATSAYVPVDSWDFLQEYKDGGDIGDTSDQVLTLKSITRTGRTGTAIALKPVSFTYQMRENRVDATDDILPMTRPRISTITSETGAITTVTLSGEEECVRSEVLGAAQDTNTRACYPQYWNINGASEASVDWFHKYRVLAVSAADPSGKNEMVEHEYVYSGAAWHYNDEPLTPEDERTWSDWRGYRQVTVYSGAKSTTRSKTVSLYLQGMDGDKQKSGTPRSVTVAALPSPALAIGDFKDSDQFAGQLRQSVTYDGATAISAKMTEPWSSETARQSVPGAGDHVARYVRTRATTNYTYLTGTQKWRSTGNLNAFDAYGMTTATSDYGDVAKGGDETCTRTWYARNDTAGLTTLVSRVRTVTKSCGIKEDALALPADTATRGDVVSDAATVYDSATATGWTPTQQPTKGDATWTGRATGYPATMVSNERPPTGWQRIAGTTYDTLGRPKVVTNAEGRAATTAYTPTDAGPLTKTVATNAKGHNAVTFIDSRRGLAERIYDANLKKTEQAYDALGRVTEVWKPNRIRGTQDPNLKFTYNLSNTTTSSVATATLKADGTSYNTSYTVYDALLRPLQTQTPTPLGGRLLTDTRYDTRGLAYQTYADIFDKTSTPDGTYTRAEYGEAPKQTKTVFDGAERATSSTLMVFGVDKWTTTTSYTGDSTASTAVDGGNATRTITDARGRMVETRTYAGEKPDDTAYGATLGTPYTSTKTGYTNDGLQTSVTGPDQAKWTYTYDLFGRQVSAADPDKGTSLTAYDVLDRVVKATDSRGQSLLTSYDELGRVQATWSGTKTDASQLTGRVYDTVAKGQLTSTTRYVGGLGGQAYTKAVTAYDSMGRATASQLTLPNDDPLVGAGIPSKLEFSTDFGIDGAVQATREPAVAGLEAETVGYEYNNVGQMTSSTGFTGYLLGASYSAIGQTEQLTLGIGGPEGKNAYITNKYEEGTGQLTDTHVTDQTHPYMLQDLKFTQDDAGNVTSIFDGTTAGGTAEPDYQCFDYDGYLRLTEAWTPKTADCSATGRATANIDGPAPYWTSYTYNTAGQRTTETNHTTAGNTTITSTYGTATGQPHPITGTTGAKTGTYTYDTAGNTRTRPGTQGTQTLTWNSEGKLAATTEPAAGSKPALKTDYLYDSDGELLIRRATGDGDTVLYLGATEVRLTTKGTARTVVGTRYYSAVGQAIAVRTATAGTAGSKLTFLAADHHGTSSLAIDSITQATTRRYSTPFGSPRGTEPTTWPDDKAFLGKPADKSTGLTHIGAREYDPGIGQFISVDPILAPENHQSLNGYSYADNTPVTASDPTGLMAQANRSGGHSDNCYTGNMSASCDGIGGNNMGTTSDKVDSGGSGATASTENDRGSGYGTYLTYVAGAKDIPVCFVCLIGAAPVVGPLSPRVGMQNYCASAPIDTVCNPEDAELGGGGVGFRELAAKWALGKLEWHDEYGEDSELAREIMMTDATAEQRDVIRSMYYNLGIVKGKVAKSISNDGIWSQLQKDLKPLVTGDHNLATVGLGSYTTEYEVLRASPKGLQVRMTVRNSMTVSSFARPVIGYGTTREKIVQRYLDNDGIIAFEGAARSYGLEVTFRTVIYRRGYRGLGG
ncbi:RHS repeat-associated core domain-containing protein (plasmid) [Streptomyces poriferorum]|uniref:RHS repeat domain-containing protein n=1 Tax=Streptomyces poriferorum TaxID=2798799 RepID=UPI00273D9D9B|nr:RHS repeat-associated core domain-containing protein [Streptomyces sp. Alt1]WLQ53888.1 RHS repeat-associated core domain-containing protein [Streptomyces sp. Alt1]